MKLIKPILAGILMSFCQACSNDVDFGEQYVKQIYIVNGNNRYVETTLPMVEKADGFVTFYCSGSEPAPKDIQVRYKIDPQALNDFNTTEFENDSARIWRMISEEKVTFREPVVTIKAGEEYGVLNFSINTSDLDPAKQYVVPITISGVSDYEINEAVKTLLYKVTLKTPYSGTYEAMIDIYDDGFALSGTKYIQKTTLPVSKTGIKVPIFDKKEIVGNDYYVIELDEETNKVTLSSEAAGFGNVVAFRVEDSEGNRVILDINYYNPETKEFVVGYLYTVGGMSWRKAYEVIKLVD